MALRVERLLSCLDQSSDIARLNSSAGSGPVVVARETLNLLVCAVEWSRQTGGAFDMAIGSLSRLWSDAVSGGAIPDMVTVETARSLAGGHHLRLDCGRGTAELLKEGVSVDLGAIGKGYAARCARRICQAHGARSALLSLGGHILPSVDSPAVAHGGSASAIRCSPADAWGPWR